MSIDFGFDLGVVLTLLFGGWFSLSRLKQIRKEEAQRSIIGMAVTEIFDSMRSVESVLKSIKVRTDPPVPGHGEQTVEDLNAYSIMVWKDCQTLKQAAGTARLFSPSLDQNGQTILCQDVINDLDAHYELWRSGLEEQRIDNIALNRIKLRATELLFLLESIIASGAMESRDLVHFKRSRTKELEEYRASFDGMI